MKKPKSKKEILLLKGVKGPSFYVDAGSQSAEQIDDYTTLLLPVDETAGEKVIAKPETEHAIYVVTKKHKASLILNYQGTSYSVGEKDIANDVIKFTGILIVIWHCEQALDEFHMLFVDTRNENVYRNISFETFGYESKDIIETFYRIVTAPYLYLSAEMVQNINGSVMIEAVSDPVKMEVVKEDG